jgi:Zn-dependent protease with chaperone function
MIEFKATYFDGKSARPQPVVIRADKSFLLIEGERWPVRLEVSLSDCKIDPPLARAARTIRLPDGGLCETDDFSAIDALEHQTGLNSGLRLVKFLESRWKAVAGCLILLALFIVSFAIYGIPFLAKPLATLVPPGLVKTVSHEALNVLDRRFMESSQLAREKAQSINALFQKLSNEIDSKGNYRLEFRKSRLLGPNAFALPSGLILVTDELVALTQNDRELTGVLAHEIFHVKERHALQHMIQSTGLFLLISALVGDIASISSFAASLPTLLVESGYSRNFEREADREAGLYLIRKGWGTKPYQDMLQRLADSRSGYRGPSAISTHPDTLERIKRLQELEELR